jgi:tRNA threonylcarbamoyladenosine biosynthesis protein TsaB
MPAENNLILAIESAIAGGSLALLRDGVEIATWAGTSDISKAEDLLPAIDDLLTKNGLSKSELAMVAVSAGPGSFTGIRIGIATALGLKTGLGIAMVSDSALRAMAHCCSGHGTITAAVPVGRDAVCIQTFEREGNLVKALDEPRTIRELDLLSQISEHTDNNYLLHGQLYEKTAALPNAIDFRCGLASAIGQLCGSQPGKIVEPLFVSKSF